MLNHRIELKAKNLKVVYEEIQKEKEKKKKLCILVIFLMFRKPQYRKLSLHLCNANSLTIRRKKKSERFFLTFEQGSSFKNIGKMGKKMGKPKENLLSIIKCHKNFLL